MTFGRKNNPKVASKETLPASTAVFRAVVQLRIARDRLEALGAQGDARAIEALRSNAAFEYLRLQQEGK